MTDTNTTKSYDCIMTEIAVIGGAGVILAMVGVIGLISMAGQALYEAYGPGPNLSISIVAGAGLIWAAKHREKAFLAGSKKEAS